MQHTKIPATFARIGLEKFKQTNFKNGYVAEKNNCAKKLIGSCVL